MILSDKTIREYIDEGRIVVEPEPEESQFQPASLDLRIGEQLYSIDEDRKKIHTHEVPLNPGKPYLGHTIDRIELPNDILAMVAGRSTVARRGVIVHMTAGICDPGWKGQLTLEMYNFTNQTKRFDIGDRVAQLVFLQLDKQSDGYSGSYQGQEGATPAAEKD